MLKRRKKQALQCSKEKQKNYRLSNHDLKFVFCSPLAFIIVSSISCFNSLFHCPNEGTFLSKIIAFRCFQIVQQATISISVNIGLRVLSLADSTLSMVGRVMSQSRFIMRQHHFEKGQRKNRWSIVSSHPLLHNTQSYESKCWFFLLMMFLVLSLSCSESQKRICDEPCRRWSTTKWKVLELGLSHLLSCKLALR